jgi:hypothetical protein
MPKRITRKDVTDGFSRVSRKVSTTAGSMVPSKQTRDDLNERLKNIGINFSESVTRRKSEAAEKLGLKKNRKPKAQQDDFDLEVESAPQIQDRPTNKKTQIQKLKELRKSTATKASAKLNDDWRYLKSKAATTKTSAGKVLEKGYKNVPKSRDDVKKGVERAKKLVTRKRPDVPASRRETRTDLVVPPRPRSLSSDGGRDSSGGWSDPGLSGTKKRRNS